MTLLISDANIFIDMGICSKARPLILALAHELGRLVLGDRLGKGLNEEEACHRFDGAFLVSKEKVFKYLGEGRSGSNPQNGIR